MFGSCFLRAFCDVVVSPVIPYLRGGYAEDPSSQRNAEWGVFQMFEPLTRAMIHLLDILAYRIIKRYSRHQDSNIVRNGGYAGNPIALRNTNWAIFLMFAPLTGAMGCSRMFLYVAVLSVTQGTRISTQLWGGGEGDISAPTLPHCAFDCVDCLSFLFNRVFRL